MYDLSFFLMYYMRITTDDSDNACLINLFVAKLACYICGKEDHLKKECPEYTKNRQPSGNLSSDRSRRPSCDELESLVPSPARRPSGDSPSPARRPSTENPNDSPILEVRPSPIHGARRPSTEKPPVPPLLPGADLRRSSADSHPDGTPRRRFSADARTNQSKLIMFTCIYIIL